MMKNKTQQYLKLGYQIPNHYFEHSKQRMLNHILMPTHEKRVVRPLWKKIAEVAAILVLLLATHWSIDHYQPFTSSEFSSYEDLLIESVSVEEEDFERWFEENYVLNSF